MHPSNPYHEGELSVQLKQRNHYAFKELYDKYAPALYSVICQMVSNKETADQVLEKVFYTIWQNIKSYEPSRERLFTWMLKIARQVAAKQTMFHQQEAKQAPLGKKEILQSIIHADTGSYGLQKVIHQLNEEQRMLIHLCYFKNFTEDQIAETMDMPLQAVKVKTRIALSALRTMLT